MYAVLCLPQSLPSRVSRVWVADADRARASVNDPASLLALAGQLEGNPQDLANMIVTDPSTNAPYSDIGNFVASATYGPRPTAEENAAADKKAAADQKASGEKVAAEAKAPRK